MEEGVCVGFVVHALEVGRWALVSRGQHSAVQKSLDQT